MALDIANTTEGISSKGLDQLHKDIKTYLITNAKKEIKDHKTLDTALENMWSGDDRKVFIQNLNSLGEQISEKLDEYDKAIEKEFEDLKADWKTFQEKNVVAK